MCSNYENISNSKFFLLSFVLALLLVFSSCEDRSIDPYERNKGNFSLYGALQVGDSPNYIRVKDLQIPFNQENSGDLNATITFENLETGSRVVLKDTVVNFSNNQTHNFVLNELLEPQGKYRIIAEREDGVQTETHITAPHSTSVRFGPAYSVGCEDQIEFFYFNVPDPEQILMEVGFYYQEKWNWNDVNIVAQPERVHDSDSIFVSMSPRNLLVEVFTPALDDSTGRPIPPRFLFPTVSCHQLQSNEVRVRFYHFGPEWKSVEPIYPVNPDDIQDVENGLGFTGAYIKGEFSFTVLQIPPGPRVNTY